jgi:NAD(P)-dependent dehydrogenase (short-subunit alcohol dehydrogenase family)
METPVTAENRIWTGTAVITGAGSGLGAAMVQRFAQAGMSIVALDIDGDRAEQTAQAVREGGGKAIAMQVDVADRAALDQAAQAAREAFGGCNILCANVGVQQFGALDRLTEQDWRWVLDVNVLGAVNTVSAFLPLIRASEGERRVVVTASSGVLVPGVRLGAYTTSKFAVMGYGETLRLELASEGIGVSVFFPAGMSSRHLESSALARPADLGPSVILPDDIEAMLASRKMDTASHVATPEHATRNLLPELERNARYIISHGQYRQELAQHCQDLLDAFDRAQSN